MSTSNDHRVNQALTSRVEVRALNWLARHMPAWVTPDVMTGFAFFAAILTGAAYGLTRLSPAFLWLASLGLIFHWFGDSLDGTIARYRKVERPNYGFFVDHALDAFSATFIFVGMGVSYYVDLRFALVALVGYLLISIYVYLDTHVTGEFRLSYIGLGPTELRGFGVLANAAVFFVGNPMVHVASLQMTLYDLLVLIIAALLFVVCFAMVMIKARQLARFDAARLKRENRGAQKKGQAGSSYQNKAPARAR
jgi:phosphatidylglycerophosphate synthase